MDIEVKSETIDSEIDIKDQLEPIIERDIKDEIELIVEGHIKEEKELIIESEWLPTKFEDEENEYYQEFVEECNQNIFGEAVVENGRGYEQYITENLDGDDSDSEYNDYAESDDSEESYDLAELESAEADDDSSELKSLHQQQLSNWISVNYINLECSICKEKLKKGRTLQRHILKHKESIEESESNYDFSSDNCGVCKNCKQVFVTQYSRYVHSKKHSDVSSKSYSHVCKICNFNSKHSYVQNHIMLKHPEVVKEFKPSNCIKNTKCPLCLNTYMKKIYLCYHFMDKHADECNEKVKYNCPLCSDGLFGEEEHFLKHLVQQHNLNSWKLLSYRKLFEDKDYYACSKCNRLFFQNDTYKLLSHFIKHDTKFGWTCKFCYRKFRFNTPHFSHMCVRMMRYYEKHKDTDQVPWKMKSKIKNLQEFEKRIVHVCPFCSREFNKMMKWRYHMRTDHEIDTLKGLQMEVVDNSSKNFRCKICDTVVENMPKQIHAHRFQHLPYKPYKCLLCHKMLHTFKMAIDHVLKRCIDDNSSYDIRSILKMQCSICNFQKINDLKSALKHYENEHNFFEGFIIKETDNSTTTCKICYRKYEQKSKISSFQHLHHHFDEKTFKCKLCVRSYPTFGSFSDHLLQLHNAQPLNKLSIETSSSLDSNARNTADIVELRKLLTYICPECNECMTTKLNWEDHIMTRHNFFDESNLYNKAADGSLKCPTCSITLSSKNCLQRKHKLIHMPHRSYMCNLCNDRSTSLDGIYVHFHRKHFTQGTFECPICSAILQTEYQRTEHLKKSHRREEWPECLCLVCYKILSCKPSLQKHMDTHKVDRFRHTCEICGTKILELRDFSLHMKKHKMRGENKDKVSDDVTLDSASGSSLSGDNDIDVFAKVTFECPVCSAIFQTEYQRTEHFKNTHPREEWPEWLCLICYKILANKYCLNRHMDIHKADRVRHTCEICGTKILKLRDLNVHMNRHKMRGENKEKISDNTTLGSTVSRSHSHEPESEKTNNRKEEFIIYEIKEEITGDISSLCSSENGPSNDITNSFEISNESDTEQEIKEKFIDDITLPCGSANSLSNEITAIRHLNKRIKKLGYEFKEFISYACPECNEGIKTQEHWHSHIRTQHNFFEESHLYTKEADGSVKCPTCRIILSKSPFPQRIHKLTHMPYKSFICNLCYERFNILNEIYSHFCLKHFAKGKFECPICNDVLQTMFQRAEHIKNIHPRIEWPELMCSICYKMFISKGGLKRHMGTHNADLFNYTSELCGSRISDKHRIGVETNEKIDDAIPSQLILQNSQSNATVIPIASESEHPNKRKCSTDFLEIQKKKVYAE